MSAGLVALAQARRLYHGRARASPVAPLVRRPAPPEGVGRLGPLLPLRRGMVMKRDRARHSRPDGWVDTGAFLARAEAYERAGSPRNAEDAYNALIIAAARQGDQAMLAEAFRRRAILAHQAGD